jgi:hypothetical protein
VSLAGSSVGVAVGVSGIVAVGVVVALLGVVVALLGVAVAVAVAVGVALGVRLGVGVGVAVAVGGSETTICGGGVQPAISSSNSRQWNQQRILRVEDRRLREPLTGCFDIRKDFVMDALFNVFSAFGLSSAAGLNAYIPILAVGLLGRFEYLTLQEPYAILSSTPALIVIAALAIIDFVADKVPAVDHVTHVIGALVHPIAGAILFASQQNLISNVHPALALGAGFVMAGGFHATRASIRPVATATTGGLGNPVVSFAEDLLSLIMSLLAIFIPILAFVVFVILLLVVIRSWRTIRQRVGAFRR